MQTINLSNDLGKVEFNKDNLVSFPEIKGYIPFIFSKIYNESKRYQIPFSLRNYNFELNVSHVRPRDKTLEFQFECDSYSTWIKISDYWTKRGYIRTGFYEEANLSYFLGYTRSQNVESQFTLKNLDILTHLLYINESDCNSSFVVYPNLILIVRKDLMNLPIFSNFLLAYNNKNLKTYLVDWIPFEISPCFLHYKEISIEEIAKSEKALTKIMVRECESKLESLKSS